MGAGKTTVGRKLAHRLGRQFLDADDELEARSGRTIADWFRDHGEGGFRDAESDLLATMLAEPEPIVLGSGGGVVIRPENRSELRRDDVFVVYLHGAPAFLASRTPRRPHRPLLDTAEPHQLFEEQYRIRDPWYREIADHIVEIGPSEAAPSPSRKQVLDAVLDGLHIAGFIPDEPHEEKQP